MSAENLINKLICTLTDELEIIRQYNKSCENLHKSVVSKNWTSLENKIRKLKVQADSLSESDETREWIISSLKNEFGLPEECSFGLLTSRFSQEDSRKVDELKRDIRRSIMVLKNRINGIGRYTESQTSALKDVLDILVPDQKGRIYNRKGAPSAAGTPMLFSKQF